MWKPESIGFHKNLRTTQHLFEFWISKNAHNTIGSPQNQGKELANNQQTRSIYEGR